MHCGFHLDCSISCSLLAKAHFGENQEPGATEKVFSLATLRKGGMPVIKQISLEADPQRELNLEMTTDWG